MPGSPGVYLSSRPRRERPLSAASFRSVQHPASPSSSECSVDSDIVLWVDSDWRDELKRTPASLGYWVDSTLSQQHTVIADLAEYAKEAPNRVLPQLCRDIKTSTPHQQRLHLAAFAGCTDLLHRAEVTHDDCVEMLCVMFTLMQRRAGHTPWQTTLNRQLSDLAFTVVCRLICQPHRWLAVCLGALRDLCARLRCTVHDRFRKPPSAPPLGHVPAPQASGGSDSDTIVSSDSAPSVEVAEAREELEDLLEAQKPITGDPFLCTLHAVDPALLGALSEARFLLYERDFKKADRNSDGSEPALTLSELTMPGVRIGGVPVGSVDLFRRLDKDRDGKVTLAEFLQVRHPDVPRRFLVRRAQGLPVCDTAEEGRARQRVFRDAKEEDVEELLPSMGPVVRKRSFRPTRQMSLRGDSSPRGRQLSKRDEFTPQVASDVFDFFRSLDSDGSLSVTWREVQLNGGMLGDRPVSRELFLKLDKDRSGQLNMLELCAHWFPDTPMKVLKERVKEAQESVLQRERQRVKEAQRNEARYNRRQQDREEAIVAARELVKSTEEAWENWERSREARQLERERAKEERRLARIKEEEEARIRIANERKPAVPVTHDCAPFPLAICVSGLRITRDTLCVDSFVEDDQMRPLAARLLQTLDAAGFCASYFSARSHLLSATVWGSRTRVYRDFTHCPQRSLQPVRWTGSMSVHVKTNIRARSDVMFRFLFEGFNWGMNKGVSSVVVGFAARSRHELDAMEEYGWPPGWDSETVVSSCKGIQSISQYYSTDGFVTVKLSARSLMDVGISATAWLAFHGQGVGFPLAATWHHQDEDL
eukprot:TRINITY_DN16030_c0_g1_i1.p1 TRINITY_DN16030_c0_g1~~TRINITY_DN16030_c0_g1_i1.p1  ORF type:complete len:851 (+),score=256.87 TRINITY_DN16030_c0_g1_i1:97-2553(+)